MAPTFKLTRGQRIFCALLLTPFVALLAWLAAETFGELARWRASSSWVAVTGTVEASGIHGCGRGGSMPGVRYRYATTREGRSVERTGERLMFADPPCGERDEARGTARRYAPGTAVTVYVDPEDATQSVLERSVVGRTWVGLALLLFTLVVLLVIVAAWVLAPAGEPAG